MRPLGAAVAALAAMMAGCLLPQRPYQLRPSPAGELLVPPRAGLQAATTGLRLADRPGCNRLAGGASQPELGLTWRLADRRLAVTLMPAIAQFGASMPVALLNGFGQLHATLDAATALGCLDAAAAAAFLRRMSESTAMAPGLAQAIRVGPYTVQKFVDVTPPVELELTYARDSTRPERYDLGYVDSLYQVAEVDAAGRGRLAAVRRQLLHAPAGAALPPPPLALESARPPSYFRLFFYLRQSESDHDVGLLAATSHAALDAATRQLLARPNQCGHLDVAGAECMAAAAPVGLEARLVVTVDGKTTPVALPATVEQAITAGGVPRSAAVLASLRVERPYHGGQAEVEVVGSRQQLLGLALCGGERIWW